MRWFGTGGRLDQGAVDRETVGIRLIFQKNPKRDFPFPISGCESFENNEVCTLHAGPKLAGGIGRVRVSTKSTSFTFVVISDGYFDVEGSTIKFSLSDEDGELYLHQDADSLGTKP